MSSEILKTIFLNSYGIIRKDKIKREGIYQNYDKGGLRMVDIELTAKSLRLVWISILLQSDGSNWSVTPDYYFNQCGGLNFLLRCNYQSLPKFSIEMLHYFKELRSLYEHPPARTEHYSL